MIGASWLPTDGYLDPSQLTNALADGARRGGCRIFTNTRVTGIDVRRTAACGACAPSAATSSAEVVVNAGGMFAAEIGRLAGVRDPGRPDGARVRRHAAVPRTGGPPADDARPDDLDLLPRGGRRARDGRLRAHLRAVVARPTRAAGWTHIPPDFNGRLLEEDWDRFEEIVVNARMRVPALEDVRGSRG